MDNIILRFVSPCAPEIMGLINELNADLSELTGNNGSSSFVSEEYQECNDAYVAGHQDNVPVACSGKTI